MQILTVVTGIVFVLLLLSLLATTLMELIASFFSLRGKNLVKALRNMLSSSDDNEILLSEFKQNSLYRHLTEQYGRRSRADAPSYISAENFQSILFDIILKGEDVGELKTKIDALPDNDLKNVLNLLLRESGGQLDIFRLEIQNWYNNVMDRAGGWYKRYTQKILVFLGLGIAVIFNADTVSIYERLSSNPEQLEQVVALAENYVQARESVVPAVSNQGTVVVPVFPDSTGATLPATTTAVVPPAVPEPSEADYQQFQDNLQEVRDIINYELESVRSPLGLGWDGVDIRTMGAYELVTKLLGFLLTALAVSLGAPFWFDLLRKMVNIRSSGNRP